MSGELLWVAGKDCECAGPFTDIRNVVVSGNLGRETMSLIGCCTGTEIASCR